MTVNSPGIPLGGIVIDFVSSVAGTLIVLTGLLAGAFRALAVMRRFSPERVEWLTAVGFSGGVAVAVVFFALDAVLG